jgi:hypothetical protein
MNKLQPDTNYRRQECQCNKGTRNCNTRYKSNTQTRDPIRGVLNTIIQHHNTNHKDTSPNIQSGKAPKGTPEYNTQTLNKFYQVNKPQTSYII